jgi:hypothetical protein
MLVVDLPSSRDGHSQHAIGVFVGMYDMLDVKRPDSERWQDGICDVKTPSHSTGNRLVAEAIRAARS